MSLCCDVAKETRCETLREWHAVSACGRREGPAHRRRRLGGLNFNQSRVLPSGSSVSIHRQRWHWCLRSAIRFRSVDLQPGQVGVGLVAGMWGAFFLDFEGVSVAFRLSTGVVGLYGPFLRAVQTTPLSEAYVVRQPCRQPDNAMNVHAMTPSLDQ